MNKEGQMAEGIYMMYRLLMVTIVAFFVFGAGSYVYTYYIDVRDVEVRILTRGVVECLVDDGVLDLSGELLDGCEFVKSDRVYVGVKVVDLEGKELAKFSEGDSGSLWIRDLFGKVGDFTGSVIAGNAVKNLDKIVQYESGYYKANYSVFVLDGSEKVKGKIVVEALVNYGD